VWNHAYRLTGSWSLAEDMTSMTASRRHELTLVRDSAQPWLYAVAGSWPVPPDAAEVLAAARRDTEDGSHRTHGNGGAA
jgi:hypothetical protein